MKTNTKYLPLLLCAIFTFNPAQAKHVTTTIVEAEYQDVRDDLVDAVKGKGLNIAGVFHASEMLSNTKSVFNFRKNIYKNAEIIEFCSAGISHDISRANHLNILLCPFKIAVFNLEKDPKKVYVVWAAPEAIDEKSKKAVLKIGGLISAIIEDADL
ncbi:MAG: DUF302 domain-containing protein [Candidatus Ruthia sp.]|nr:DUF302 domain-containing protein [Candidatus Ruthturnera sp.]MBT4122669.1 DUF302 domain-containing protein [Candidatus Ruthturnera sp.]MBT4669367.1 DUF302 domain-containing protein [Candidatus Ruthturnera sp.]MBT6752677.1 DUF302 domain-containing protein [Candidatus Thioglobus sp.]MBT6922825.1 DUF302 domain-containing protein [Candidatus Ruthturnera sp.]